VRAALVVLVIFERCHSRSPQSAWGGGVCLRRNAESAEQGGFRLSRFASDPQLDFDNLANSGRIDTD